MVNGKDLFFGTKHGVYILDLKWSPVFKMIRLALNGHHLSSKCDCVSLLDLDCFFRVPLLKNNILLDAFGGADNPLHKTD